MSDLENYPKQTFFKTTLAESMTSGAKEINFTTAPDFTMGNSTYQYFIIEPKSADNREIISVSALSGSVGTIATRGLKEYKGGSDNNAESHNAGVTVILSNPYQYYEAIADAVDGKMDESDPLIANGAHAEFSDSSVEVWRDGDDMKFKDVNHSTVSLSTLAATGGADEKTKVSSADSTAGYLEDKLKAGDGLTTSGTTGSYTMSVELDSTPGLEFSGGKLKAKAGNGITIDSSGINSGYPSSTYTASETMSSYPLAVRMSSTGSVFMLDDDQYKDNFVGFTVATASMGETVEVQHTGEVSGFSGLTTGSYYFNNTNGAITATAAAGKKKLGVALNIDTLLILEQAPQVKNGSGTRSSASGTGNEDVVVGFRPSYVWIFAEKDGSGNLVSESRGHSNGSLNDCLYWDESSNIGADTIRAIYVDEGSSKSWRGTISMLEDGFRMSLTKVNSVDDLSYTWLAFP
jgi:hypothetical protein